ncbi:MAG: hypothetical protein PHE15_02865 [Dehalococcoidales bacterium]|nr:hypothetical protein [Dehalococcoidales bacterium]
MKSPLIPKEQEVVVSCPGCNTLETLLFVNGKMVPTRKFKHRLGNIFHSCGTERPCKMLTSIKRFNY